ncbi:unnamed protein product [Chrysoparadoxa australica]
MPLPMRASPGFKLFGTVTTPTGGKGGASLGGLAAFEQLFTQVLVESLTSDELEAVALAKHPALTEELVAKMLRTFQVVVSHAKQPGKQRNLKTGFSGRSPAVPDFLRLVSRAQAITNLGEGRGRGLSCTEAEALGVIQEVLDVLAGFQPCQAARAAVAEQCAAVWGVRPESAAHLVTSGRPQICVEDAYVKFGRVTCKRCPMSSLGQLGQRLQATYAETGQALRLMESIAACVEMKEPVLLVGETGCGKTSLVQRMAATLGQELVVQNLSLQTDSADLLGGYRPVELRHLALSLLSRFYQVFQALYDMQQNAGYQQALTSAFEKKHWKRLGSLLRNAVKVGLKKLGDDTSGDAARSKVKEEWMDLQAAVTRFERQRDAMEGAFAFSFVEGVLVKALKTGQWVLLDEINLASAETLQRLSGLLQGPDGSICLSERGDTVKQARHPSFRVFAAMNPPTDATKRDLPPALRCRLTELYVPELEDPADLRAVAAGYLSDASAASIIPACVDLYLRCRQHSEHLSDGSGERPRYSLRTLSRALSATKALLLLKFPLRRAAMEGFSSCFSTQLGGESRRKVERETAKAFKLTKEEKAKIDAPPPKPGTRQSRKAGEEHELIGPFWLSVGSTAARENWAEVQEASSAGLRRMVLTPTVDATCRALARAIAVSDAPILLQGPTSSGKTTTVEYVAARCGHHCVRINNHEHTDIQEYTGAYAADESGKLSFQEGLLVQALRKGYWIILDELNLAPSEVLEALNRLLDDNRELFLAETQEVVTPHPSFRLFATQNPPGAYGGRKPLSRAFRNRFLELHVDSIPSEEWRQILHERCGLAPSHAALLVSVLDALQVRRQHSRVFQGKDGFITPRDLMRWANRCPHGKQAIAEEGYMLLAERLRVEDEKAEVRHVLEETIGVKIDPETLYSAVPTGMETAADEESDPDTSSAALGSLEQLEEMQRMLDAGGGKDEGLWGVALTNSLKRLFRLVGKCLQHKEPVLLVGNTGCGKTTVCQLFSMLMKQDLLVVNCHQNSEAGDLLGGLRPVRGRSELCAKLAAEATAFLGNCAATISAMGSVCSEAFPSALAGSTDVSATKGAIEVCVVPAGASVTAVTAQHLVAGLAKPSRTGALTWCLVLCTWCSPCQNAWRELKHVAAERPSPSSGRKRKLGDYGREVADFATNSLLIQTTAEAAAPAPPLGHGHEEAFNSLGAAYDSLIRLCSRCQSLFEWSNGPLVDAMKDGSLLLLDEISLAEDAVLERLNSVLEPSRSLVLAEKGGQEDGSEVVKAAEAFRVMATMNPGGDFGKRELSPALRSRFTEIWVPDMTGRGDIMGILVKALVKCPDCSVLVEPMLEFAEWMASTASLLVVRLSVRDMLAWAGFVAAPVGILNPWQAFLHGAAVVILDGLGLGTGLSQADLAEVKAAGLARLAAKIPAGQCCEELLLQLEGKGQRMTPGMTNVNGQAFGDSCTCRCHHSNYLTPPPLSLYPGVPPFYISTGPLPTPSNLSFSLSAPTTAINLWRVMRALQLRKAVLLEGSPGVGKTSLIDALARASGHQLVRINLSEQTDVSDLLGSDLPVPPDERVDESQGSGSASDFAWSDGVLLRALKAGHWVLLDELNLASQAVLEGLNSVLDHREQVFIPELNRAFRCPPSFRVFAAQNPLAQGGGRKGLPASFLNRFTKVYVDALLETDLLEICQSKFHDLNEKSESDQEDGRELLRNMIRFNRCVEEDIMVKGLYGRSGSPWEFNLRDVFRVTPAQSTTHISSNAELSLTPDWLVVGGVQLERGQRWGVALEDGSGGHPAEGISSLLAAAHRKPLEAVARCVQMGWPALLVGHRASGKGTIVRGLAAFVGAKLITVAMTPLTDVTELLGCYEQVDAREGEDKLVQRLLTLANSVCRYLVSDACPTPHTASITSIWCSARELQANYTHSLNSIGRYVRGVCDTLPGTFKAEVDALTALSHQVLTGRIPPNILILGSAEPYLAPTRFCPEIRAWQCSSCRSLSLSLSLSLSNSLLYLL